MELLSNLYFLALFLVLAISFFYVATHLEIIPAFLYLLLSSLGIFLQVAGLPKVAFLKAILLPMLLIVLFISRVNRGQRFPLKGLFWIGSYFLVVIISTWTNGGDLGLYRSDLTVFLMAAIIALCPQNEKTVKYLTIAIALWGVANLMAAIASWAGVSSAFTGRGLRVIGFMGHSTLMGLYFVVSVNAIHILYLQASKPIVRIVWLGLGIGVVIGLMGTLSRGAIGAWVISFLWIQYRLRGLRIGAVYFIAGLAILTMGLASLLDLDSLVLSQFTGMDRDASAQARIPLIEMAFDRFTMAPVFGLGMGQGGLRHIEVHNSFVQVLLETGIVGIILFTILIWKAYSGLKYKYWLAKKEESMAAAYYFGLQVSLIAILFDGLTHVFILTLPLWTIIGIAFLL